MRNLFVYLIISVFLTSCNGFFKYSPARENPTRGEDRAKKNVEEGRGISLGGLARGRGNTNYEFSTSNPMWRASLEILDFLPMTTVDYSGGIIISDWYTDNSSNNQDSIKITIRFLTNEIRSDSIAIKTFYRTCKNINECFVSEKKGSLSQELRKEIVKLATKYKKETDEKNFVPYIVSDPSD